MNKRSFHAVKRSAGIFRCIEALEQRAYLNGIELGAPVATPVGAIFPNAISMTTASGANADFNGDGKTDLVVSDVNSSIVGLYLGNGNGSFQAPVTAAVRANSGSIAIADMNGDGKLDIVSGGKGYVSIVHGDGTGGLGTATNIATGVASVTGAAIAVADLNGDGLMDIVTADTVFSPYIRPSTSGAAQTLSTDAPTVAVLIQQPGGSFVQQSVSTAGISSMAVGDFNGDGRPDLAFTLELGDSVAIMLNKGDGTFGAPTQYPVGAGPISLVAADFNGDGKLDLASLAANGAITFVPGNGDGTFKSAVSSLTVLALVNPDATMVAAQLNSGDTLPDLLIHVGGHVDEPAGVVGLNNGDGTFRFGTYAEDSNGFSTAITAGKLNTGDTFNDVVMADVDALTSLFNVTSQDTTPPTASLTTLPVPELASPTVQFTVNFSDNGQIDASTVSANSITVTGPDGTVLPATLIKATPVSTSVQATYQITFAGQYYGTYTFTAATSGPAAVRDANGNALINSTIATYGVTPPIQPPFAPTVSLSGQFPKTAASGEKGPPVKVTLHSENGFGLAHLTDSVITLAASPTSTLTSNSIILGTIERHVSAKAHNLTVVFKEWNYPATPGNYFIVANADGVLPAASSASAINVQPPMILLNNALTGSAPSARNGRLDFSLQMFNTGNAPAKGILLVDVLATSSTSGLVLPMTQKIRVNVVPGKIQVLQLHVPLPKAVPSGTYRLLLSLNPLTGFDGVGFTSNTLIMSNSIVL